METILQLSVSWIIFASALLSFQLYKPTGASYINDSISLKYIQPSKTFVLLPRPSSNHIPVRKTQTSLQSSPFGSNGKVGRLKKQELKYSQTSIADLNCRYKNILYKLFSSKNLQLKNRNCKWHNTISKPHPVKGHFPQFLEQQKLYLERFKRSASNLQNQTNEIEKRKSLKQNGTSNEILAINNSIPNPPPRINKPAVTVASSTRNTRRKITKSATASTNSPRSKQHKTLKPTRAAATNSTRKPRPKTTKVRPTTTSTTRKPRPKTTKVRPPTTKTTRKPRPKTTKVRPPTTKTTRKPRPKTTKVRPPTTKTTRKPRPKTTNARPTTTSTTRKPRPKTTKVRPPTTKTTRKPRPKTTKVRPTFTITTHKPQTKTTKRRPSTSKATRKPRPKTTKLTVAATNATHRLQHKNVKPVITASLVDNPIVAASFIHNQPNKITITPTTTAAASLVKTKVITNIDTKTIPYNQHQTFSSSLPKIFPSTVLLPHSSIMASKSETILLSSSHQMVSTPSLFIQPASTIPQSKLLTTRESPWVIPAYNSLPVNTLTTSTNIHSVTNSELLTSLQLLSKDVTLTSSRITSMTGSSSHQLYSSSEEPLMTKMPTPFITLQLRNTKNNSTNAKSLPKIENNLDLTPTFASASRRSKKNVSLLSNQLRTASLSTSNIVLLLNNSLLATLDTKQGSILHTATVLDPNLSSNNPKIDSTKTLSRNTSRPSTKASNEATTVMFKSPILPTYSIYRSFTHHPNTVSSTLLQPTLTIRSNSNNFSQTFLSSKHRVVSIDRASVSSKLPTTYVTDRTKTTVETKSSTFKTTTIEATSKPLITSTSEPSTTNFSVKKLKITQDSYIIVPDWKIAKQEWKAAWHVHIYIFGSIFALLAIYLLVSLLRLRHTTHLLNSYYFVAVNLLLFIFCLLRALFLLVDGYNSNHTYPYLVGFLLYYLAFPCLTSPFSLIFYTFLKTAKVQYLSSKFQCLPLLITVIILHFILPITAAVLIGLDLAVKILLFVCQIFFVLWGLLLFLGYIVVYKRLHFAAEKRQKLLLQLREAKIHMDNYTIYKERLTLCLGVTVALFSSVIGTFCTCLQVYSALYFLGVFPNELPRPWPWWGYQTAVCFFEFLFCIITIYITTLPFKHRSKYGCDPWFYCSSYTWLCHKEYSWNSHKDINWSNMDENISSIGISKDTRRKEIKAAGYEIIPLTISLSQENENLALDNSESDSMLIVQNGFVRFRTNEELEELRQSPRVPRMHAVAPIPVSIPKVPKTLQWSDNTTTSSSSSKYHQNTGFQAKDALLSSSPECLSSSTSPPSSQFNRVSTAGSELTFKAPSLSLASSIDKELEHFFCHSSRRSLSSVTSADVLAIDEDSSSDSSVFQTDDNADAIETVEDKSKQMPSFFLTEDPEDSLKSTGHSSEKDFFNVTDYIFHSQK